MSQTSRLLTVVLATACLASCARDASGPQATSSTTRPAAAAPVTRVSDPFLDAARDAGAYLAQAVRPDGRFTYEFDPATSLDSGRYNLLRHAGSVYAMLEVYETDRDPALLAAAERAMGYLLAQVKPGSVEGTACLVEGDSVKLGGNGLAAVALARHATATGDRRHVATAQALCRWMILNQERTGRFVVHTQRYPDGPRDEFESAYYPGEAILALSRVHALDPDGPWMAAAHRGAGWLIEVRDRGRSPADIPHDHWLLYALNELHRHEARPTYVPHTLLITRAILDADARVPRDAAGVAEANPIATRVEGLSAAHEMLARAGETTRVAEIEPVLRRAADVLLDLQFTPAEAAAFPEPGRVAGGFAATSASQVIRVDTVQHAASALLGARRVLADPAAR